METTAFITNNITYAVWLNAVGVVEQDNGAKVHFSLINYPLLFLPATHTYSRHVHTHQRTRVRFLEEKGESEGVRKRVISAGYLSSLPLVHPNPLWK